LDTAIFSNGCCVLPDLETKLEKEEGENCQPVLFSTTWVELYLVANFLWAESTAIRTDRDCGNVGIDSDDDEEVLSLIKIGVLFIGTIFAMGKLCHHSQCGDCGIELTVTISTKLCSLSAVPCRSFAKEGDDFRKITSF